jgi:hypothetical protein
MGNGYRTHRQLTADVKRLRAEAVDIAQTVQLLSDEVPWHRMTSEKTARVARARGFLIRQKKRVKEATRC